eukprot:Blabericola_migrator_1__4682@NODE_2474_length_2707_cov_601_571591_g1551_i0_p4_GENE_NODE_2474_length_2707_cov_601_571591_g1551_i0NODE_2474_length_2707_cov_601_571591_g1551_i0_p4_ORF_typecomplete_len119_score15_71CDC48_N/PF02359_18/3_1e18Molydop_binding/PF01568_21/1_6e03Molydop_binding/PF01568_21/0_017Rad9_Rad53_bind/PF08605_10/0_1_NODE_2474_length_2707_cov_601_571591_g1551_i0117473
MQGERSPLRNVHGGNVRPQERQPLLNNSPGAPGGPGGQPPAPPQKRRAPNRLIVQDPTDDENSVVYMSPARMEELQLFRGDTVKIRGKKRHYTICLVLFNEEMENSHIRMNKVIRKKI